VRNRRAVLGGEQKTWPDPSIRDVFLFLFILLQMAFENN
jgi:hypothetical protein